MKQQFAEKMEKKNFSSIFDNCDETASQEIYLRRCEFAFQEDPPDSDPSVVVGVLPPLNDGVVAPHRVSDDSETDSVIGSGYDNDVVENQPIRFVSPPQSTDTVDLEEDDAVDRTVPVESKVDEGLSLHREDRGKKVKVPLRDVVKAIVMNSRNADEADKEIEKMSYVQILMQKGFKFPQIRN